MHPVISILFRVSLVSFSIIAEAQVSKLHSDDFRNRPLNELLREYRDHEYKLVFSDQLVSSSKIVHINPPEGEPIERLQQVLRSHKLSLKHQPELDTWYVISAKENINTVRLLVTDKDTEIPISGVEFELVYKDILESSRDVRSLTSSPLTFESDTSGVVYLTANTNQLSCIQLRHPKYKEECFALQENNNDVRVSLTKIVAGIEEVVVTSNFHFNNIPHAGMPRTFSAQDLQATPSLAGDPLHIVHSLPGVSSQGISAKPNIRGGADDEMLILFDGIELIDPFHLKDYQSLLSGLNPNTIDNLTVYTGGYPAQFGGKMSGVMDIRSPSGPGKYGHILDINPFSTTGKIEGQVFDGALHWNIVARHGLLEETLEQVNDEIGSPKFSDNYATARWEFDSGKQLEFGYLSLRDNIQLNSLDDDEGESMRSIYDSKYGWIKSKIDHSQQLTAEYTITAASINNERNGFINEPENIDESVGTLLDKRHFNVSRASASLSYQLSDSHYFNSGLNLSYLKGSYDYQLSVTRGELAALLGLPLENNQTVISRPEGVSASGFVNYRYTPSDTWSVESGIRLDSQEYYTDDRAQVSPRTAVKWKVIDGLSLKMNIGRYYQAPAITDLQVESGDANFFAPQRSDHYILGAFFEHTDHFSTNVEVYRKDVISPRPRFDNLFHPYGFIPELAPDRVEISPEKSEIRGYEILFEYAPSNNLSSWMSYTKSSAKDILGSQESLFRRWNQNHTIQGGLIFTSEQWTFSAKANWHSGWKTTGFHDSVFDLETPKTYRPFDKDLPNYFSLNLKASYFFRLPRGELETYLEITNATNRNNIGSYELEISKNPDDDNYSISTESEPLLPIIPSVGLAIRF